MTRTDDTSQERPPNRWQARPHLAAVLRVTIFLGPVAASAAAGWAVTTLAPPDRSAADTAIVLVATLAASVVTLVVTDRLLRRLLPVAVLLRLALVFPEHAPSRLRMARDVVRRRSTQEHLARLARAGQDPSLAAEAILSLVAALDEHDRPTRGHAERVRLYTELIAEELGLPARDRDRLRWAALLHDVGKLAVPAATLNKPGSLDQAEWELMRRHPDIGAELARPLMDWLGEWGDLVAQHHERWDGTGYPRGLAGTDICRGGRIVAVADAFDVMTAARAYRRPVARPAAYRELIRFSGSQFDPEVVRAMLAVSLPRVRRVQGAMAVLADVPLLAARTVPASTVAQAVGAGVLVVGGAQVDQPAPTPPAAYVLPAPRQQEAVEVPPAVAPAPAPTGEDAPVDPDSTTASRTPTTEVTSPAPGGGPADVAEEPAIPVPEVPKAVEEPVDRAVEETVDLVDDPVATVPDTLVDTVGDVEESVGSTVPSVEDPVGAVDDAVGGLVP
ncbi:MAG: HD domain-containing phosphohydrolase [Actinomycetes bacterium]